MSQSLRNYVTAKAMLLATILDETWSENNHVVEERYLDFVNAKDEL